VCVYGVCVCVGGGGGGFGKGRVTTSVQKCWGLKEFSLNVLGKIGSGFYSSATRGYGIFFFQ